MDKFQAAFETLYCLSTADGQAPQEVTVIQDFLTKSYGKIAFDPNQVVATINGMTPQGIADEFAHSVTVFKNLSSAQDRVNLLDFALNTIVADGTISPAEEHLFYILGNTWNIDIKKYLENRVIVPA